MSTPTYARVATRKMTDLWLHEMAETTLDDMAEHIAEYGELDSPFGFIFITAEVENIHDLDREVFFHILGYDLDGQPIEPSTEDEVEYLQETCPLHGPTTVTHTGETRGSDPYEIRYAECGCNVIWFGSSPEDAHWTPAREI